MLGVLDGPGAIEPVEPGAVLEAVPSPRPGLTDPSPGRARRVPNPPASEHPASSAAAKIKAKPGRMVTLVGMSPLDSSPSAASARRAPGQKQTRNGRDFRGDDGYTSCRITNLLGSARATSRRTAKPCRNHNGGLTVRDPMENDGTLYVQNFNGFSMVPVFTICASVLPVGLVHRRALHRRRVPESYPAGARGQTAFG